MTPGTTKPASVAVHPDGGAGRWVLSALAVGALAAALAIAGGGGIAGVAGTAVLAALALAACGRAWAGVWPRPAEALRDLAVVGVIAGLVDPAASVCQVPASWGQVLALSPTGGVVATGLYLAAAASALARAGRRPQPLHAMPFLALPLVFDLCLLLASPALVGALGRGMLAGIALDWGWQVAAGRAAVLALVNFILVIGIGFLMDRCWRHEARLALLLVASALAAAVTPIVADAASSETVAGLPALVRLTAVVVGVALAQAGLWAQTFLVTGSVIDALRGRRPTFGQSLGQWRSGAAKGAVYGGLFMLLVHLASLVVDGPLLAALVAAPVPGGALVGAVLFPLARTIIESFDGSPAFHRRLVGHACDPQNYLHGLVAGAAAGWALAHGLYLAPGGARFAYGFVAGAASYAGVLMARDAWAIARGPRQRLQTWRLYALGGALGGFLGGALAWYLDASQLAVVTHKLARYAAVSFPAEGIAVEPYVIYPLFSKWGAMDLGAVTGGVGLIFRESVSGVINWSLAAPLFSINLVLLTALVRRSLAPIRGLLSAEGLEGLVEQAFRVVRWGLWMAPVIYSFLRLAPDPTWYNQDGAVRTVVATVQSLALEPDTFRAWSLQAFLGLLAYDWLRVLIWADHMGLRVATLVNFSFVGMDIVDEKAARAIGHSGRTRVIPEGIRRFLTWAPLLIPFYIPRGAEWDLVWAGADQVRASAPALLPAVSTLMVGYAIAGGIAVVVAAAIWLRGRGAAGSAGAARQPALRITNGEYAVEMEPDGRGFSTAPSARRPGLELDLTRRPDDPLQLRGKFLYFREAGGGLWSLGRAPCGRVGADYEVTRPGPTSLRLVNSWGGIRAEAEIGVADGEPVETWRIRLVETEGVGRVLDVVSYQELALAPTELYRRTPAFHGLHVGTWFVRPLGAILARNRLLKNGHWDELRHRATREVMFHAVRADERGPVRLVGYEDQRSRFIGDGTLRAPALLARGAARRPDDEGLLYGFDPAASLWLRVAIPAKGHVELLFVDGYAESEEVAAARIARQLGITQPKDPVIRAAMGRRRALPELTAPPLARLPYAFSSDGSELHVRAETPRPWHHLLASPRGHGAVVGNDGEICSFAGNAQQNALTPFTIDSVPTQLPGQGVLVMDLASGEIVSPGAVACRAGGARAVFGRGYAVLGRTTARLGLELTVLAHPEQPVELRLLRLRNRGGATARYRVLPWLEMVLGEVPTDTIGRLETRRDDTTGALLFRNPDNDFRKGWAFVATSLEVEATETVRARLIGAGRDLAAPHLLVEGRADASQEDDGRRVASFVGTVEVPARGEAKVAVVLGQVAQPAEAAALARRFADPAAVEAALAETRAWWARLLSGLRLETNDPAFDRMVNGWLPYQLLTARLWGRTGPSQRGGAFGYRDQLQDVLPLLYTAPGLARRQILMHAGQQLVEGDVLKWWHESWEGRTGLGDRTRASDPHLWLPYVVVRYVAATGDLAVLDEEAPFLEGPPIPRGRDQIVIMPRPSRDTGTVLEHCRRAVDLALARRGANGLPLLGTGDWNDGLDLPGAEGRGESVWVGFFLHDILQGMADLAGRKGDGATACRWRDEAARLRDALDAMWREDRYVRLTTDDGVELAGHSALMSAWPALSGAVDLDRATVALEGGLAALEQADKILLLTPPFTERSLPYPGRLADYPPGVRENGGQYSHGASWLVDAMLRIAEMAEAAGDAARARGWRDRAAATWVKISPLHRVGRERLGIYGLPPHQQPADIHAGPGHDGRGGWAWYTGAAARMLCAAYALFGLRMEGGRLVVPPHAFEPRGHLRLRRVVHHGRTVATADAARAPAPSA